jgi:NitT/TauT family transport system permease protein
LRKEQEDRRDAEQRREREAAAAARRLGEQEEEARETERRRAQDAADEAARQRAVQRAAAEAAERSRKEHEDNLAAAAAKQLRETKEEARRVDGPSERQRQAATDEALSNAASPAAIPAPSATWARRVPQAMILPLLLLLVWQFASMSHAIDPIFLPAPTDIVASWSARLVSGELLGSAIGTLIRFVLGTLVGTVLALAFGKLLMMAPPRIRISLNPLLKFFSATPAVAFIPLATVMLGLGVVTGVAVTAIAIFFPILAFFMAHAANETPDPLPLAQQPGGAVSWQIPFAAALAFSATLAAEIGATGGGLMVKIMELVGVFDVAGLFAMVLTAAALAVVIKLGAARVGAFADDYLRDRAAPRWSPPAAAADVPLWRRVAQGAVAPVLLVVLWQIGAALGLHHPFLLPSPAEIIAEWFHSFQDIVSHTTSTVLCLIGGVLLSLTPALLLTRVMEAHPRLRALLLPLVRTLGAIPAVIWALLAIFWFGIGAFPIIFAAAVGAFFPVLLQMTAGLDQPVDRVGNKTIEPVRSAEVLAGSIAAVRVAFMVVLAAEFFAGTTGVAYLMMQAAASVDTTSLYAALLMTGLVGLLLEAAVTLMMTRVFGVPGRAILSRP